MTGGKNTRMNGKKKLFLTYDEMPFYAHIFQAFRILPKTYLSVEAEEPYKELKIPMVQDIYPAIGPIGGIYSGLLRCPEDALFVTACDMPLIDRTAVKLVCSYYRQHPGKVTVVKAGERIHPLFGIYPKTVLPLIERMIDEKNYKVMDLFTNTDVSVVELEQEKTVKNINTPWEYEQLRHIARQKYGTETESF